MDVSPAPVRPAFAPCLNPRQRTCSSRPVGLGQPRGAGATSFFFFFFFCELCYRASSTPPSPSGVRTPLPQQQPFPFFSVAAGCSVTTMVVPFPSMASLSSFVSICFTLTIL